jgi:hypothetical protein
MLSILERNIAAIEQRLVLVAPPSAPIPAFIRSVNPDRSERDRLVREMQRLRGSVYLDDGAVQPSQLSAEGLHETAEDARSWHLLMLNRSGGVNACVWYLEHENPKTIDDLRVRHCPLNSASPWRHSLRQAIAREFEEARRSDLRFAEVGGWAVAAHSRCTAEGLLLALAAYSLGRALGGAIGLTTATVRHASSTILRRLGGSHLKASGQRVPTYFDEKYGCDMELLRFDSRQPSPKYARLVELLKDRLSEVAVVMHASSAVTTEQMEPLFAA